MTKIEHPYGDMNIGQVLLAMMIGLAPFAIVGVVIVAFYHPGLFNHQHHEEDALGNILSIVFRASTMIGVGGGVVLALWKKQGLWLVASVFTGLLAFAGLYYMAMAAFSIG